MGHLDVFLVLVEILVSTRSGEVAMMVGTTVHQTKVRESATTGSWKQSKDANASLNFFFGNQAFENTADEKEQ
jgi:hypothetical protein